MSKQVILTGLRANNDLHIGNYFGALLPMVDMATQRAGEYQVNLFVPDLHSFTTPIDHSQLQASIMNNIRVYAAAGLPLDNPDVYIYRQSYVSAHSELTWILDCFSHFGELRRMIQFKEKTQTTDEEREKYKNKILNHIIEKLSKDDRYGDSLTLNQVREITNTALDELEKELNRLKLQNASVGLFSYPVLMAADILLYGASYVPVGDDQTQHLEFTRDIAQRLNTRFGQELFTIPFEVKKQHELFGKDQGLRIKDLADPTKKMSKSADSDKGVIFLTDSPEQARKKVMSATTDSLGKIAYDPQNQPGLANLLDLYELLGGDKNQFIGQEQYGPFKTAVADKMAEFLTNFQTRLEAVDEAALKSKLVSSEESMRVVANETLLRVQKAVGLR